MISRQANEIFFHLKWPRSRDFSSIGHVFKMPRLILSNETSNLARFFTQLSDFRPGGNSFHTRFKPLTYNAITAHCIDFKFYSLSKSIHHISSIPISQFLFLYHDPHNFALFTYNRVQRQIKSHLAATSCCKVVGAACHPLLTLVSLTSHKFPTGDNLRLSPAPYHLHTS